ncbi:AraC family transcriptional regulator [Oceanobacillus manasiensis]|uniref:AraC family transcriptional regulator n=1 Tax=Oceanobacillus manasiensis TaxID=586413 RepID=UPI0005A7BF5D|nr:AraC family transcriptional regulator [Oceanobacillus manasiensis]
MTASGVPISMVYPIIKSLQRHGIKEEQLFDMVDMNPKLLRNVDARISAMDLVKLMRAAAVYTEDAFFGLHQGEQINFEDLGVLGYVMLHSKTIGDALRAYQRYNVILYNGFNLDWEIKDNKLEIQLDLQPYDHMSRHCIEDMASSVYHLTCKLSNRKIPLHSVQFSHENPGDDVAAYVSTFGIETSFAAEKTALCMDSKVLDFPVLYANPEILRVFEKLAKEGSETITQANLFSYQVVKWLKECIPSFFPSLNQTANHLGLSSRTLQANLKDENTSFSKLSIQVRKEMAESYLADGKHSVGDIAYLLHYSEPSAFQNAFKSWTGVSPGKYREKTILN